MGNSCCKDVQKSNVEFQYKKKNSAQVDTNLLNSIERSSSINNSKIKLSNNSKMITFTYIQPSMNSRLSSHIRKLQQNSVPPQSIFCSNMRWNKSDYQSSNPLLKNQLNSNFLNIDNDSKIKNSGIRNSAKVYQSQIGKKQPIKDTQMKQQYKSSILSAVPGSKIIKVNKSNGFKNKQTQNMMV